MIYIYPILELDMWPRLSNNTKLLWVLTFYSATICAELEDSTRDVTSLLTLQSTCQSTC